MRTAELVAATAARIREEVAVYCGLPSPAQAAAQSGLSTLAHSSILLLQPLSFLLLPLYFLLLQPVSSSVYFAELRHERVGIGRFLRGTVAVVDTSKLLEVLY
jgi:hypothetical protein